MGNPGRHPSYGITLSNMASCLHAMGKYDKAMVLFEQCRRVEETSLGKLHSSFAITLGNMAACAYKQGEHDRAIELYEECR